MTITTDDLVVDYTGNGVTTVFPFPFNIPEIGSASVYTQVIASGVLTLIASNLYSGTGFGLNSGGSITYPLTGAPLASTHRIIIMRSAPYLQEVTISNQTRYDASVVMSVWDRLTMLIQQLQEKLTRAALLPINSTVLNLLLEAPQAGRALVGNVANDGWENGPSASEIAYANAIGAATGGYWSTSAATLIADNTFVYVAATNKIVVVAGAIIQTRNEGFSYEVAASGATDHQVTTAGGVKLYAITREYGIDVRSLGAPLDGTTNTAAFFQKLADLCDTGAETGVFVPNHKLNYHLDTPVVFDRPDFKLWGVKGASYQRDTNTDKGGNFLVGSGAAWAIDFGGSAAAGTVSTGQWNVANIGVRQATGVPAKTKHGFAFTSAHNGPHRGAMLREISAIGMDAAVYVNNPGVSTALATMEITNSCLNNNNYGVLSAGNVLGFRFVGNQCEQNVTGAIHGTFSGPITIEDNMLEGQPNPINIQPYLPQGNRPFVNISGNYFEANSGGYVAQIETSSQLASVTMKDNYNEAITASDYLRLRGSLFDVHMYDEQSVTLTTGVRLAYGSRLVGHRVPTFGHRGSSTGSRQFAAALSDYSNLLAIDTSHTHVLAPNTQPLAITPYGERWCCPTGQYIGSIAVTAAVGDLIVVNALCKISDDGALPQLFNQAFSALSGGSVESYRTSGRWALVVWGFRSTGTATSLQFRLNTAPDSLLLGVAVKNYGAMTTDESAKIAIRPCLPNLA